MKKGFIEMIEYGTVTILYPDGSKDFLPIDIFPQGVHIDMEVTIEAGKLIKIEEPSPELKQEINALAKKLFVSFKDRKKK
jgi:hypothetical protein